jgi:hypothetical protein
MDVMYVDIQGNITVTWQAATVVLPLLQNACGSPCLNHPTAVSGPLMVATTCPLVLSARVDVLQARWELLIPP